MKFVNLENPITVSRCLIVGVMLLTSAVCYAGDRSGEHGHNGHHHRWSGWIKVADNDQGHHYGHDNENGRHHGFQNERNHWYSDTDSDGSADSNQDSGVVVDLTVYDFAINPGTNFNATYNSLQTVQDVLTDLLGDSTAGYALQQCYETSNPIAGTTNNCTTGETLDPLGTDLTLEAAGLVADPVVYLVKQ